MNKKQKSRSKQISFNELYRMACTDSKFLNALLKNKDQALRNRRITLSKTAKEKLDRVFDAQLDIKGKELLQYLNKLYHDVFAGTKPPMPPPPPPPWGIILHPHGPWDDLLDLIKIENRKMTKELINKLQPGPEKITVPNEEF